MRVLFPVEESTYVPPATELIYKLYRIGLVFPHAWKFGGSNSWFKLKWVAKYQWRIIK